MKKNRKDTLLKEGKQSICCLKKFIFYFEIENLAQTNVCLMKMPKQQLKVFEFGISKLAQTTAHCTCTQLESIQLQPKKSNKS